LHSGSCFIVSRAKSKWENLQVSSPYWTKGTVIAVNNNEAWVEVHRDNGRNGVMATVDVSDLKVIVQKPTIQDIINILETDVRTLGHLGDPTATKAAMIIERFKEYYEG